MLLRVTAVFQKSWWFLARASEAPQPVELNSCVAAIHITMSGTESSVHIRFSTAVGWCSQLRHVLCSMQELPASLKRSMRYRF